MNIRDGASGEKREAAGGPNRRGLNYSTAMRRLIEDICQRLPDLSHIDMQQVAVGVTQTRNRSLYGTYATLTPLRFRGGERIERRKGRLYTIQKVLDGEQGREVLYILTFFLPRFHDLDFTQKLITVFHELWHISPACNGDIRRFAGRCYAHSGSQKEFDRQAAALSAAWLALDPPAELYEFLRWPFEVLCMRHGSVYGHRYGQPKIYALHSDELALRHGLADRTPG